MTDYTHTESLYEYKQDHIYCVTACFVRLKASELNYSLQSCLNVVGYNSMIPFCANQHKQQH